MLQYALYKNKMNPNGKVTFFAKPVNVAKMTFEEVIKKMSVPGSILKPTEIVTVYHEFWRIIHECLVSGKSYEDEYILINWDMRGVYLTLKEQFDWGRHCLEPSARLKNSFKLVAKEVKLVKVEADDKLPEIKIISDWNNKEFDDTISKFSIKELKGQHLKIYDRVEGQGVFMIDKVNGDEYKVDQLLMNEPKRLVFRVPQLLFGKYVLEVRNTTRKGTTLRSCSFSRALNVSAPLE